MPGASGASLGFRLFPRSSERVTEHPLDVARATGRPAAARSACRGTTRWSTSMPTLRWPAVEDPIDAAVEIGAARARRSSATHGPTDWPTARPRACRMPSADRARLDVRARAPRSMSSPAVASSDTGQPSGFGNTSVSGPGQNASASIFAPNRETCKRDARRGVGHMRDQRVEARPALRRIEPRDRFAVRRVSPEAVNRLGRKRHQPAVREYARGRRDRVAIGVSTRVASFDSHGGLSICGIGAGYIGQQAPAVKVTNT